MCVITPRNWFFLPNRNLAMNQLNDFPDLSTNTALQEL